MAVLDNLLAQAKQTQAAVAQTVAEAAEVKAQADALVSALEAEIARVVTVDDVRAVLDRMAADNAKTS